VIAVPGQVITVPVQGTAVPVQEVFFTWKIIFYAEPYRMLAGIIIIVIGQ
jgi:hypothetical protein